jgi:hypothetical protein
VLHYLGVIAAAPEPECEVHVDFKEEGPKREGNPWWPRCHGRIDGRLGPVRDYSRNTNITVPGHVFPVGDDGYFVLYGIASPRHGSTPPMALATTAWA